MHACPRSTTPALMGIRLFITSVSALLSILTLGVGAGVAWLVATLYFHQPPELFAPIIGLLLGWALRLTTRAPGLTCAGVAVLATVLAALCVNVVLVGMTLASYMGLTLREALGSAGVGMVWELTRLSVPAAALAWYGAGLILALGVSLPRMRHRPTRAEQPAADQ